MKSAEPKNAVWESTRSILLSAANDKCNMRFAYIALLSMALDLLVFQVLFALGAHLELAQITSFFAGAILSFALNADGGASELKHSSIRWARFLLVAVLALLMRSAVLMLVVGSWHWQPQTAIFVAIPMATAVFQVGVVFFIHFLQSDASENPAIRWSVITISVVAYVLILKLIFMGCVNLIPEEAYYWNYAQHLDWGYLDHPPMVAWLIWISTNLLGKSEVSVRLPAYVAWIIAAFFMFRLTSESLRPTRRFSNYSASSGAADIFWPRLFHDPGRSSVRRLGGLSVLSGTRTGRSKPPSLVGGWHMHRAGHAVEIHDRASRPWDLDVSNH